MLFVSYLCLAIAESTIHAHRIQQRDVLFRLSGFENLRCIRDMEVDVAPISKDDWAVEHLTERAETVLGLTTELHKDFFTENIKLAQLSQLFPRLSFCFVLTLYPVARFLDLFESSSIPLAAAYSLADAIKLWRNSLPESLNISQISNWSSDNVWAIFLLAMAYRLECVLFRTIRRQYRGVDEEAVEWSRKRLLSSMFELDTLLRRAMVHDVIQYCPPSL